TRVSVVWWHSCVRSQSRSRKKACRGRSLGVLIPHMAPKNKKIAPKTALGSKQRRSRRPTLPPPKPGAPHTFRQIVPLICGDPAYGRGIHKLLKYARKHKVPLGNSEYNWAKDTLRDSYMKDLSDADLNDLDLIKLDVPDTRCSNNTKFM